ncbi:MAG: MBG domain-containing protein [Pseudohongiella nitratireducens]|nr:MBG domain-containing protein [Pseudohongiella nitratireducens]
MEADNPKPSLSRRIISYSVSAVLGLSHSYPVLALPKGENVQYGDIQIDATEQSMLIEQLSQFGVINWESFSIGADQQVDISQLNLDAAILNRVTGANPSELLGQLSANGRVYVINPNGVLVGEGANINTAEFIASALDVADSDFLDGGDLTFAGQSDAAVINLGQITADNGNVILIAQVVENAGELHADNGTVGMAAGQKVILQPDNDQRLYVESSLTQAGQTGITNTGLVEAVQAEMQAAGGSAYELAINQSGIVRATGVTQREGRILLTSQGGDIDVSGTLEARSASGDGGQINVGGGRAGQNPDLANAANVNVSDSALIDVSAKAENADAGTAIVWSDRQTNFAGNINGQGGSDSGDGAFVEVSGREILNYTGNADLRSTSGETGTLWLDPAQAVISTASNDTANGVFNNAVIEQNLATANVVVEASNYSTASFSPGSILVSAPVSWSSNSRLTLKSAGAISIENNLSGANGELVLSAGVGDPADQGGNISSTAGSEINVSTLQIQQNNDAQPFGVQLPPTDGRKLGSITLAGSIKAGTLDILRQNAGWGSAISINNTANQIARFQSTADSLSASASFEGDILIDAGNSALAVAADLSDMGPGRAITFLADNNIQLLAGTQLSSGTNANVIIASRSGAFANQAGANAVLPGSNGRFLIYSDTPDNISKGGLSASPLYNHTYAADMPASITETGNRFVYSLAPEITLTADNVSRSQGAANPTLSYSVSGLVGGDSQGDVFTGTPALSTTADNSSANGDYNIDIATGSVVMSDFGYGLNLQDGTLTVGPDKELLVTADNLSRVYGEANPAFTSSYSGFVGSDDDSLFDGFTINYSTTAQVDSPVGNYNIVPSGANSLSGYDVNYRNGTLTISPRLLNIRVQDASIDYLDSQPDYSVTYSGLASFDSASDISGLVIDDAAYSGVGGFDIVARGASNSNYTIQYQHGTLEVNPRPVTLTVRDTSRRYGQVNPTFSLRASNTGGASYAQMGISQATFSTLATSTSDVGEYDVSASGISNSNFAFNYIPGTLKINPVDLTINIDNATRQYGDMNPDFNATVSGLVAGDSIDDAVDQYALVTSANQSSNVGQYAITVGGTVSRNYNADINNGILGITKAPLSLVSVNAASRLYGDDNPDFTLSATGLKNGDLANEQINAAFSTSATQRSSVGDYSIDVFASSVNYDIQNTLPGVLTITRRPISIRPNDIVREYGDANPDFTYTQNGLASFDDLSLFNLDVLAPTQQAPAGDYTGDIIISPVSHPNYDIQLNAGDMVIEPAPIQIVSENLSRQYGAINPQFRIIDVVGMKLGQSADVLGAEVAPQATETTGVGAYELDTNLSTGNYTVTNTQGSLSVTPAQIEVSVNEASKVYGDAEAQYDFNINGLVAGDTQSDVLRASTSAELLSDVGTYNVSIQLTTENYELANVFNGLDQLTVTPRPIDVMFQADVSREYRSLNYDLYDRITVDNALDETRFMFDITGLPGELADVGDYPLDLQLVDPNYELQSLQSNAVVRVTPKRISVGLSDDTLEASYERIYGNSNPEFLLEFDDGGELLPLPASELVAFEAPDETASAGTYQLGISSIDPNYHFTPSSAPGQELPTLTVTPRTLTVNYDSYARYWGTDELNNEQVTPPIIGGMGLVNGDTLSDLGIEERGNFPGSLADIGIYATKWAVDIESSDYHLDMQNSIPQYLVVAPNHVNVSFTNPELSPDAVRFNSDVQRPSAGELAGLLSFDYGFSAASENPDTFPQWAADLGLESQSLTEEAEERLRVNIIGVTAEGNLVNAEGGAIKDAITGFDQDRVYRTSRVDPTKVLESWGQSPTDAQWQEDQGQEADNPDAAIYKDTFTLEVHEYVSQKNDADTSMLNGSSPEYYIDYVANRDFGYLVERYSLNGNFSVAFRPAALNLSQIPFEHIDYPEGVQEPVAINAVSDIDTESTGEVSHISQFTDTTYTPGEVTVYNQDKYVGRMDLWYEDFPGEAVSSVSSYLEGLSSADFADSPLAELIVGQNGTVDDLTQERIESFWDRMKLPEAPASSGPEDQAAFDLAMESRTDAVLAFTPVLRSIVEDLGEARRNGEELTPGQEMLAFNIGVKFNDKYDEMIQRVEDKRMDWEREITERTEENVGTSFSGIFGGGSSATEPPYMSFFDDAQSEIIEENLSTYTALAAAAASGAVVATSATSGAVAAAAASAIGGAIFANQVGASAATTGVVSTAAVAGQSTAMAGAIGIGGIFAGVTFALTVGIIRSVQIAELAEREQTYDDLVDTISTTQDVADMDFGGETDDVQTSMIRTATSLAMMDLLIGVTE